MGSAGEPDADYFERLPASRARLQTLIGVAPAAPIVTGRPESAPSIREGAASVPEPIEASQVPPASRVRPKHEPRPEPPRSPMASKHTLDAVAINREESPPIAAAPERPVRPARKARGALLAAAFAVAAVLALVAVRRAPHLLPRLPTLAAEPSFVASIELPEVSPLVVAETAAAELTPHSLKASTPPARHGRSPRHRHAPASAPVSN
jgi:hypothetical protein